MKPDLRKFRFGGDIKNVTLEEITTFLNAYDAGILQPYYKSEPPVSSDEKVQTLVGLNHHQMSKPILVVYYVHWCKFSQALLPILNDLVNIVPVAKYNVELNEVQNLVIKEYPTIRYYAEDGRVIEYNGGERSLDNLVHWV